jgi:hypothetical protein
MFTIFVLPAELSLLPGSDWLGDAEDDEEDDEEDGALEDEDVGRPQALSTSSDSSTPAWLARVHLPHWLSVLSSLNEHPAMLLSSRATRLPPNCEQHSLVTISLLAQHARTVRCVITGNGTLNYDLL